MPTPPLTGASRATLSDTTGYETLNVATGEELQRLLSGAPGPTVLLLAPGTYSGSFKIAPSPRSAPLKIRPAAAGTVRFVGETTFEVRRSSVAIEGLIFETTVSRTFTIRAADMLIAGNTWIGSGGGESDDSTGLIYLPNDEPNWDPGGLIGIGAPLLPLRLRVANNTFSRPKNTPLWQSHGIVGTRFEGNAVVGPHGMIHNGAPAAFASAVKIGYGFGSEPTETVITGNTFTGWKATYVIGIKGGKALITENWLDEGKISLRSGNGSTVSRNIILNGGLDVFGADHMVNENVLRMLDDPPNEGALVLHYGEPKFIDPYSFDGISLPLLFQTTKNSTFSSNVLISNTSGKYAITVFVGPDESYPHRAEGNRLVGNLIVGQAYDVSGAQLIGLIGRGDEAAFYARNTVSNTTAVRLVSDGPTMRTANAVSATVRELACGLRPPKPSP